MQLLEESNKVYEVIEYLKSPLSPKQVLDLSIKLGLSPSLFVRKNEADFKLNKLKNNTKIFREGMIKLGFEIKTGNHPIVPVMLYDDHLAQKMSSALLEMGIYVIGFFYPVVPKGQARIRVQLSASHSTEQVKQALNAFKKVGKKLGVIN